MPTAFVLINTKPCSEADVLKDLRELNEKLRGNGIEIKAVATYGKYDIFAMAKADTMDKLKEIVTWKIRRLEKVESTLTMIIAEDMSNIEIDKLECEEPTTIVLTNTEIGYEADVLKSLRILKEQLGDDLGNGIIYGAYAVYGKYDLIIIVKADTMDKLKEIVTWKIRRLDNVRSAEPYIVVLEKAEDTKRREITETPKLAN